MEREGEEARTRVSRVGWVSPEGAVIQSLGGN